MTLRDDVLLRRPVVKAMRGQTVITVVSVLVIALLVLEGMKIRLRKESQATTIGIYATSTLKRH